MIFRDGCLTEADPVSPAAASFGAFSTFGCQGGRPILWSKHVTRLCAALNTLAPGIPITLPNEDQVVEFLSALGLRHLARGRVLGVFLDEERWRIELSAMAIERCGFEMKPLRLLVIPWAAAPPLAGFKTLARLPWDLARRQAQGSGWDDALLVDGGSRILETSVANVFVRCGSEIVTPMAPESCLPGIMRAWLVEHLGRLGLEVRQGHVSIADVSRADEVWVSNAIAGVRRVAAVNDVTWTEWPWYERLRELGVPAPGWLRGQTSASIDTHSAKQAFSP